MPGRGGPGPAAAPAPLPTRPGSRSGRRAGATRQREELLAGAGVVADEAAQRRGDGPGAALLDAAQRHARMLGLEDDPDAAGRELVLEPAGDLHRHPLLDLQI